MGPSWKPMTLVAVILAYLLTVREADWMKSWLVWNFVKIWLLEFFGWAVWTVVLYPKFFSPLRGLPGPKGNSFFMGQTRKILALPTGTPLLEWINSIPNDGIIRYLSFFNEERLLITSPKGLAEVLVHKSYDFVKPVHVRFFLGRVLGMGILLAEGEEHKKQRKNLGPAFAFRHVKDLYPIFWDKAREGTQVMTQKIIADAAKLPVTEDGKPTSVIEIGGWASRITLDIIGSAGIGRDFDAIQNPEGELMQTYTHLFKPSRQAQALTIMYGLLPGWFLKRMPIKRNEDIEHAAKVIRDTCRELIAEKRAKLSCNELTDVDILSVALESGAFAEENLIDQLMTFLAAGHETTASAILWAIYALAVYPDVQSRLRKEVREHLPSPNEQATVSSIEIDHMPYLNAVCNEILRYYSPVPMTLRDAAVDTTILGHRVPKGTKVVISPAAVNRCFELWGPEAGKFDPERWLPQFEGDKHAASGHADSNYSFLTFLHGPRSCMGISFARAELACVVAAWAGRFEFSLKNKEEMDEAKLPMKRAVTARPLNGLHVHATVLDGW